MPERRHLPNRRASETIGFELNGHTFTATISRFWDGKIGEIFLQNHKRGGAVDTAARDSAVTASIALQHGASVEELRRAHHVREIPGTKHSHRIT
jgi:hypothetical protein